jgi:hypothetical protein
MRVLSRYGLTAESITSGDVLLLEGSWPSHNRSSGRWSLDSEIDARFTWIDRLAMEYAERAAQSGRFVQPTLNFAFINALGLRYFFVKLLRIVAFFREVRPLVPGESVELHLSSRGDELYADLFHAIVAAYGAQLDVHWHESSAGKTSTPRRRLSWRQWAARARRLGILSDASDESSSARVVLCGNPRILNPVCAELVARGSQVWWLYERFAVRCWWRWRRAGVEQLVCESEPARSCSFSDVWFGSELRFEEIDLARPVERWLGQRAAELGIRQSLQVERIDAHFRQISPTALVLDEDATPLKRIATGMARQHGARTVVVQHGAPCGRFGFAPLAADRICVWGESSRRQLRAWGIPDDDIQVTGWPHIKRSLPPVEPTKHRVELDAKRFLLLATVPPRNERPDGVEFHLTTENHAAMFDMVCRVLGRIAGATLTVKLHPRAGNADFGGHDSQTNFPIRVVRAGDLTELLAETDCVLSCASTAGIEAALAGAPVVQLLPAGSGAILPAEDWGFIGSARSEEELTPLVANALERGWQKDVPTFEQIVAAHGRDAAARIVDCLSGDIGDSADAAVAAAGAGQVQWR